MLAGLAELAGLAGLALVLYLQFARQVPPCSLCIYQRLADLAMILLILIGFFVLRRWSWALAGIAAGVGAILAAWQWHLADIAAQHRVEACANIQLLPQTVFSSPAISSPLASALTGQGSCAVAGAHRLLGWPITHWSLAFFLACALLLTLAVLLTRRR
jgi:disulfide bond formation protein DsbB